MLRTLHTIKHTWGSNYRHHGGFTAVARCLLGSLVLQAGLVSRRRDPAAVEIMTFSVVPWMTALWVRLLQHSLADHDVEILIGDCSGGLGSAQRRLINNPDLRIVPCLNRQHGDKIDLFLTQLGRAPYVAIVDDDVFWLSDEPLKWALAQLEADPRVAVVSLMPRQVVSSVLRRDGITRPMGSHCLVLRRQLWRREQLSFAVAPAPREEDDWFYDTGDFANRELLRRGYRVVTAEPDMERHFVAFDGVSSWVLKLQGQGPDRLAGAVAEIPVRQKKAIEAIYLARGLSRWLGELEPHRPAPEILKAESLAAAERALANHIPESDRVAAERRVEDKLRQLRDRLSVSPVLRPVRGALSER